MSDFKIEDTDIKQVVAIAYNRKTAELIRGALENATMEDVSPPRFTIKKEEKYGKHRTKKG